jgi:dTDP-4-amino-4,6-dideoxygalactose transaminase
VEPDTLCISPDAIEAAITPRTKAIIPVHLAGHPADLDPIRDMARRHNLTVVEDAAHCLPGKYKGRTIGSEGNPTSFSFYATKNITTAEGGMLTAEPEFLEKARVVSLHGMSRDAWKRYDKGGSWFYEVVQPGFKYNMTDIQAAMGIWQLKKLNRFQTRRREVVARYHAAFGACDAIQIPVERPEVEHTWHLYCIRIVPEALTIDRGRFIEELTERQIGTSVHFIPIHIHPYYRDKYGYKPDDFPVAFSNYERLISIPLNPRINDEEVARVIDAVLDIAKTFRR